MTKSLVKSTCRFLKRNDLTLSHHIKIKPLREKEKLILSAFYALSALSPTSTELSALNGFRLYLQVNFLSEVVQGLAV